MIPAQRRVSAWMLPVGLAVLVVVLVTIALTRGPVTLDPETAEGTVQEYLLAISESRWDDALAVIHDDWRGTCQEIDLESFAPGDFSAELGSPDGFGGGVVREDFGVIGEGNEAGPTIPDNVTHVDVTINRQNDGGFGNTWQEHVTFEVTFDGDFWWIVNDPWPYFVFSCPGR